MSFELPQSMRDVMPTKDSVPTARSSRIDIILDTAPQGAFVLDADWKLIEINPEAERIAGVSRAALLGKSLTEIFPAFTGSVFEQQYAFAVTHQEPVHFETYSSVQKRWYEVRAFPSSTGLNIYFNDSTERKLLQESIYQTVATSRCLIWHASVHNWGDGRLHWNSRAINEEEARKFIPLEIPDDKHFLAALDRAKFPEETAAAVEDFAEAIRTGASGFHRDFRCIDRFGQLHWLHEDSQITALSPSLWRVVGVCTDITERKQTEEALTESELRFRSAIHAMQEGFILQNSQLEIEIWNQSAESILGYTADQMMGRTLFERPWHAVREDGSAFPKANHPAIVALRTGHPQRNVIMGIYKPDGEQRWISLNAAPLNHLHETRPYAVVTTFIDITETRQAQHRLQTANRYLTDANTTLEQQKRELAEANARLAALAREDGLTGLKNHRAFQERLALEFERGKRYKTPLSMLFFDVDRFKPFNDTFGHPAGDQVLKVVAEQVSRCIRVSDTAARYGGEEFAVLLPETEETGALELAERLRESIALFPWSLRPITISIGVSTLQSDCNGPSDLVEAADSAVYMAKALGRNRVVHYREVQERAGAPMISSRRGENRPSVL